MDDLSRSGHTPMTRATSVQLLIRQKTGCRSQRLSMVTLVKTVSSHFCLVSVCLDAHAPVNRTLGLCMKMGHLSVGLHPRSISLKRRYVYYLLVRCAIFDSLCWSDYG